MLERFSCPRRPTAHPFESPVRRHVPLKSSPPVSGAQCRNTVRTTKKAHCQHSALYILAERKGLEPSASGVTGRRYNRLNYRSGWWAVQDLNLWPPPCKGGAQPTELTAHDSAFLPDTRGGVKRSWGMFFFLFLRWIADAARHPGVVASRRGAGDERGKPLYTPYDPLHPLSAWWRASLSHVVYPVRRSPLGASRRASSRVAGDMRACCGAPAARGSPPRPGSLVGWNASRSVR